MNKNQAVVRLRAWLLEEGASPADLGAMLGCTRQVVHLWLSKGTVPSLAMAVRIEEVTGIAARSWVDPIAGTGVSS